MNSINEDNAEYKGKCGAYTNWYHKNNTLVMKGKGREQNNEFYK